MGPQGLMVVEDCDRTVVLAPAAMDAPPSELVLASEAAPGNQSIHSDRSSQAVSSFSADEQPSLSVSQTQAAVSPPNQVADTAVRAAARTHAGTSSASQPACRSSGDDRASTNARAPPKQPAFLRGVAAPPKA